MCIDQQRCIVGSSSPPLYRNEWSITVYESLTISCARNTADNWNQNCQWCDSKRLNDLSMRSGAQIIVDFEKVGSKQLRWYLEIFLSDISNRYIEAGLDPRLLFEHITQFHYFLEKNKGPYGRTSIPQIEAIIEGKKNEERRLEAIISSLESQKKNLQKSISDLGFEKAKIESELHWDAELKERLSKDRFKDEDVGKFVQAANLMKHHGYDIFEVINKFSEFEEISDACFKTELRDCSTEWY